MTKVRRLLFLSAVAALSVTNLLAAHAVETPQEADVLALINSARSAHGLTELEVHSDLVTSARGHADRMLSDNRLSHNPNFDDATTGWTAIGENVGYGKTASDIFKAFMASPSHRANILGDYNQVGIGVSVADDGRLWVTVVFMQGPADLGEARAPVATNPISSTYTGDPSDYPVLGLNTADINQRTEIHL